MKLTDILDDPTLKARFLSEADALIQAEVAGKRGLSGMAIKAGFAAIQKVRPDIVVGALDMLLPHFAPALETHFQAAQASGDVATYFTAHASQIADAMLAVTDARAQRAQNAILKKTYQSLRGQAHTHTAEAMPRVGRLLAGFVGQG